MIFLIKRMCAIAAVAVFWGSAIPAFAQTSDAGVTPILISGDQSPERIAQECGLTVADIRGQLVLSPPTAPPPPGDFNVQVTPNGDRIGFTDTSPPDQYLGTPGVKAVGVRRNGTYVYCYDPQVHDTNLDAPGSGVPNQITFIWGPGPCPLADVTTVCSAYNTPERTVDFIQGHVLGTGDVNLCGCPPAEAVFCDATLPQGTPGACIPAGDNPFQASDTTGVAVFGTGTCGYVTTFVGGRAKQTLVCN